MAKQAARPVAPDARRQAHARFARAAVAIYVGAAAIAVAMLITSLATDRLHELQQRRRDLLLDTQVRAAALARQLSLLMGELRRLGLRSEVDLLDHDVGPERSLLRLTHERSAFFNVGVAIVDHLGRVVLAVPQTFMTAGSSVAGKPWFDAARREPRARLVPVEPERSHGLVYVVSPLARENRFAGALLGALDLARPTALAPLQEHRDGMTLLVARDGAVVFPASPPALAREHALRALLRDRDRGAFEQRVTLQGRLHYVAAASVGTSGLRLVVLVERELFAAPARARLTQRLAIGLSLALVPLAVLVMMFTRSLAVFRRSEEQAGHEERMRDLGEATNLIAHEIKNSLNSLRLGVDVVLRSSAGAGDHASESRPVAALRDELQRLTDFTGQLLIFSKGITPRPIPLDLGELAGRVAELARSNAADAGVALEVARDGAAPIEADPTLLHVVISNMVSNAIEAAASEPGDAPRWVALRVASGRSTIELRVEDSGAGVPEPICERLFEPFVTGKPSGVGIGLALSRKIARAHDGEILLERARPRACFLLSLPARPSRAEQKT